MDTLTCAQAAELAATNPEGTYKAKGYVTEIATAYSAQYNNVSFWMADTEDGGRVLEAYRATGDDAATVKVGDLVVVEGTLKVLNTTTMEFDAGCTVKILEAAEVPEPVIETVTIAEALAAGQALAANAVATEQIYVAGTIKSISEISPKVGDTGYGNATFAIVDESTTDSLICFRSKSLNNEVFTAEDEIAVGGQVLMIGKMKNYVASGSTESLYELVNCYIVEYTAPEISEGIKTVEASVLVSRMNGQLLINSQAGDNVAIYSTAGQVLYNARANGQTLVNGLNAGQVVIVRVNNAVAKVIF